MFVYKIKLYICYEQLKQIVMEKSRKTLLELTVIANEFLAHCEKEKLDTEIFWSVDINSSDNTIKVFAASKMGLNNRLSLICGDVEPKYDVKLNCVEFKYGDYIILRVF